MSSVGMYLPKMHCYSNQGGSERPSHGGFLKIHGRPHSSVPGGPHMSHYGDSHVNHKVACYIIHQERFTTLYHGGPGHLLNGCEDPKKNIETQSHGEDNGGVDQGLLNNQTNYDTFYIKENQTMKRLNEKLLSYLGEICSLKQKNAHLEKLIHEWHENKSHIMPTDQSQYSRDIQELQNKISSIITEHVSIARQIDNDKLALDDFINKYEIEHNLRNNIQADVTAMRHILEGCKEETGKLESEVEILEHELLRMRRDSEQEINYLTSQLGPRVSVEVEAIKSKDLAKALFDMRHYYENLIESNQIEFERLYTELAIKHHHVVVTGCEKLDSDQSKIINLRNAIQTMEIELESELNKISVLQDILAEEKACHASDIIQIQTVIDIVEDQLQKIRSQLQSLNDTNKFLSTHNMHLEITTYQQLLDEVIQMTDLSLSSKDTGQTHSKGEEQSDWTIEINL